MIGVFSVHAATIDNKGFLGKALFPIFSMVNHDCIGNSKFQMTTGDTSYSQQPRVLLRASTDIAQGEEITVQVCQYSEWCSTYKFCRLDFGPGVIYKKLGLNVSDYPFLTFLLE